MRVNPPCGSRRNGDSLVGVSPWIQRIRSEIERVAAYNSTGLVTGPTGTGKEMISRSIHRQSARADGPFVPVDCAAMAGELFASQLFGITHFTPTYLDLIGTTRSAAGSFAPVSISPKRSAASRRGSSAMWL